jgi:hypothetical protein
MSNAAQQLGIALPVARNILEVIDTGEFCRDLTPKGKR